MVFTPRLTAPSGNNKYYLHTKYNGYNSCILINKTAGSVIPNCVGYAYGRFMEEAQKKSCKLSRSNAENWYGYNDGYKRGQTPKLGAVMCWRRGKVGDASDGAGHVGIVEVMTNNSITVSMSAYGSTRWFKREFKKGSYNYNGFTFQGFIYNPDIKETSKTIDEIAKEVIKGTWGNGSARKTALTEAGYDYTAVQKKVNEMLKR